MRHDIHDLNWRYLDTVHDPLEWEDTESELRSMGVGITEIRGFALRTNICIIGDNSPAALKRMLESSGARHIYLETLEVRPEDAMISRYEEAYHDDVTIEAVRDRIDEFNARAEDIVERCPEVKVAFAVVHEVPIGIVMADPEVARLLRKDLGETLTDIIEWESRSVEDAKAADAERVAELRRELKGIIREDPRFRKCGNKSERKAYAHKIWDDRSFRRFMDVFRLPNGRAVLYECQYLVEEVYQESKGEDTETYVLGERVG